MCASFTGSFPVEEEGIRVVNVLLPGSLCQALGAVAREGHVHEGCRDLLDSVHSGHFPTNTKLSHTVHLKALASQVDLLCLLCQGK